MCVASAASSDPCPAAVAALAGEARNRRSNPCTNVTAAGAVAAAVAAEERGRAVEPAEIGTGVIVERYCWTCVVAAADAAAAAVAAAAADTCGKGLEL